MLKEKSKSHAKWKLIILAPLLCFVIIMFANPHYYDFPEEPLNFYNLKYFQKEAMRVSIKTSPADDINDNPVSSRSIRKDSDEPLLDNPVTMSLFSKEGSYNISLRFDANESGELINEQLEKIDIDNISNINVTVPNDATMGLIFKIRQLLIERNKHKRMYFIHY